MRSPGRDVRPLAGSDINRFTADNKNALPGQNEGYLILFVEVRRQTIPNSTIPQPDGRQYCQAPRELGSIGTKRDAIRTLTHVLGTLARLVWCRLWC
jgi:hypothetical protein